jgi:hypothetical protein
VSGRGALLAVALGCLACGGGSEPSAANPGPVSVELVTPYRDDGAVLFRIGGGPVTGVSAVGGLDVAHARLGDGATAVLVRGALANGAIVRLELPDRNQVGRYSLTLLQAAGRDYRRRPPEGYALRLASP